MHLEICSENEKTGTTCTYKILNHHQVLRSSVVNILKSTAGSYIHLLMIMQHMIIRFNGYEMDYELNGIIFH